MVAKAIGGNDHHLRFIQLPYHKHRNEAVLKMNQEVNGKELTILDAAEQLEVFVTSSAPFNLGKALNEGIKPEQMLIDIINTKGILSSMVGVKQIKHAKENIGAISIDYPE